MKKAITVLTVVAVLGFGALAFAGWGGPGYGHMGSGPGYGHMGYGSGPMMGYYGNNTEAQKFLEETADLRRTIHEKRFEYFEALRTGDEEKAEALDKELEGLFKQIQEKAPDTAAYGKGYRGRGFARGGYGGPCWQ